MKARLTHGVLAVAVMSLAGSTSALAAPPGPLAFLGGTTASGIPLGSSGPSGMEVRFIDRGTFWIAVLVRNISSNPVTLVRAQTPEPLDSLVRETRAGFSLYKPCSGDAPCAWPSTPTSTRPLTLRPHAEAAVKFNYELGRRRKIVHGARGGLRHPRPQSGRTLAQCGRCSRAPERREERVSPVCKDKGVSPAPVFGNVPRAAG